MNLDEIYKNNRSHVAKVLEKHRDGYLKLERERYKGTIDYIAFDDEIKLFDNAIELILNSDLK